MELNVIGLTPCLRSPTQNDVSRCKNHSILKKVCKQMPRA
jgi:hypothetical protein